jgi:hypothetical protein
LCKQHDTKEQTPSPFVCMLMEPADEQYRPLDEMTFREAALAILGKAGKPLHYYQISAIAIATGYWRKQDEHYIKEQMYQVIKKDITRYRSASRFVQVAPGTYTVNPYVKS